MSGAYIEALDYHLPHKVVSNSDLQRLHPEWRMEEVAKRTGVITRYWCEPEETALDLAEVAAKRTLLRAKCSPDQIDSILFCTQTPDYLMPPNACLLQARLGAPKTTAALDFTHACSGFIYGLYIARSLILSRAARRVLLVAAETYSRRLSADDRGPATLFGDGAAASLISFGDDAISEVALGTDGTEFRCFYIPSGGAREPLSVRAFSETVDKNGNRRSESDLYMDGPSVLKFVSREIPAHLNSSMKRWGLEWKDIDLVIFHQASKVSLEMLLRALRLDPDRTFSNIDRVGNTVSASIPIALADAEQQGRLRDGMRVLLVGFGVGMSWGSCVIRWRSGRE
jgi:3-oxoacyl-[acyl-carrier-protein] synthase III